MISQRDAFFKRVYELAKENRNIIVISADMGTSALEPFKRDLPGQFIDAGIAEQNAINVAAGLAIEGKKVFVFAIAPFITMRCYEQIRTSICMMNLPVTIVGVGAGVSYDEAGPTHWAVEDLSVMRCLPNMVVLNASQSLDAAMFAEFSSEAQFPVYVRFDRKILPEPELRHKRPDESLTANPEEADLLIITTGNMFQRAVEVAEELKAGVIEIFEFPIVKPTIVDEIEGKKQIVTLEEHTLPGGLGSAVLEVLSDNNIQIPVKRIGMDISKGYCYQYGREAIQKHYGLDKDSIIKAIKGRINHEKPDEPAHAKWL